MALETQPKTTENRVRATPEEEVARRVGNKELVLVDSLPVFVTPEQDAEVKERMAHWREWAGPESVETLTGPKDGRPDADSPLALNVYIDEKRWLELHLDEFAEQASQQHQPQ